MTGFLIDTNVIGETVKARPEPRVLAWFEERTPGELFLAAVTFGELVRGARRLEDAGRQRGYERWIRHDLVRQFEGRILPFDRDAAAIWGEIMAVGDRTGRPRPAIDAQIAAIARRHDLTLVTRNLRDFEATGATVLDPWAR